MDTPFALGRHVEHDERSRAFVAPSVLTVVSKSWPHYGPVFDQGNLGSCTGNAITQCMMTKPFRKWWRNLTEDDAVEVYSEGTVLDNVPGYYRAGDPKSEDTGSTGLAVTKVAQKKGWIGSYDHAFGFEHFLSGMMTGPAIVGMDWTQDMFYPNERGFVEPTGATAGGHEVLILGVSTVKRYVTGLNSWGPNWGFGGKFRMSYDAFADRLSHQGDVIFPRK